MKREKLLKKIRGYNTELLLMYEGKIPNTKRRISFLKKKVNQIERKLENY